jgi:hypothetical protein
VGQNDTDAQKAILVYINKPDMDDHHKADVIEAIGNPQLGEMATQEVVEVASTSPAGKLRDAAITACAKIGPRAVNPIREKLTSIAADPSETPDSRKAARQALDTLQAR